MSRFGTHNRLIVMTLAVLCTLSWTAASAQVPSAPTGHPVMIDRAYADSVARGAFGLEWDKVDESPDRFVYGISGFRDARKCPLEGLRDSDCGDFAWAPSRVTVYRSAWDGALSGHLAQNRAVAVDLESETAPFSEGTMHGILVAPSSGIDSRKKPVFGWYLSRSGESVAMQFSDVTGDGLEDVLYTYRQMMPGGVVVVPCDVWSFADMVPTKSLSSGEKLSGVSTSTFEGVPVILESEGRHESGLFVFGSIRDSGPDGQRVQTQTLTVERGVFRDGQAPSWELQVVADTGAGWFDYLSTMGTPCDSGPADPSGDAESWQAEEGRCDFSELPPDTPIGIRRVFLDIEGVCRFVDAPVNWGLPVMRAAEMIFRGTVLWLAGYPMLSAVFFESAAVEMDAAGMSSFPVSAVAAVGSAKAADAICAGSISGTCLNPPGSGYRGLLADWVLGIPGVCKTVSGPLTAWLRQVGAID